MNIYAVTMVASTLTIPLALLYRVLNPLPPKAKLLPERRVIGAIYHCDIRHIHAGGRSSAEIVAHYASEAALDAAQVAGDARQKALQDAEIARQSAARAAWDATTVGRVFNGTKTTLSWVLALPLILLLLAPFVLLFGLPIALIIVAIGFKLCCLIALGLWIWSSFMSDVRQTVRDEISKK